MKYCDRNFQRIFPDILKGLVKFLFRKYIPPVSIISTEPIIILLITGIRYCISARLAFITSIASETAIPPPALSISIAMLATMAAYSAARYTSHDSTAHITALLTVARLPVTTKPMNDGIMIDSKMPIIV